MLQPHAHTKFGEVGKLTAAASARGTAARRRRAMVSTALAAVAIVWWLVAGTRGRHSIYDPGPLSSAHLLWQGDCARCHDNDGKGGFRAAVSDAACLSCHQATAHSEKQLVRSAGTRSPIALAADDGHGGLRAAGCTTCHVEHRGKEAFAVVSDSHCVQCHGNLRQAIRPGATLESADRVTAFDTTGGHPYFGQALAPAGVWRQAPTPMDFSALADPTRLKFNHKVHNREVKPLAGETTNCTICHSDRNPSLPAGGQDRRYMQPVSYARNCQSCHPLNLPSGVPVAHAGMEVVEAQLMSLPEIHRQWALRLEPSRQRELLKDGSLEAWGQRATAAVEQVVSNWIVEMSPKNARGAEQLARVIQEILPPEDRSGSDPRALALYMAFGAHDQAGFKSASCAKCHELEDVVGVRSAEAPGPTPATQPVVAVPVLRTLPTGIPPTPRRWFTRSRFDHRAHQGLDCLSCHARAAESENTSDLLLPNLTWRDANGVTSGCAQCHHPGGSEAAPSHCTTCHTFHDGASSAPPRKQHVMELLRGTPAPRVGSPALTASNDVVKN